MSESAERSIAQSALVTLLKQEHASCPKWFSQRVYLAEHPFGFSMPPCKLEGSTRHIHLLAYPGYTEPSVEAMAGVARWVMAMKDPPFLRIIYGHESPEPNKHRDVFFELGTYLDSYIVGGCKLGYNGEGPRGTQDLENVYHFLALVFDVAIQRVSASQEVTQRARKELERAWAEAESERRAE